MDKEKIIDITKDVENRSNKDLFESLSFLSNEFEKTKQLIIDLTRHLDSIEILYNKVNNEIKNRQLK